MFSLHYLKAVPGSIRVPYRIGAAPVHSSLMTRILTCRLLNCKLLRWSRLAILMNQAHLVLVLLVLWMDTDGVD